ncbi:MAG: cytochrome C oxidase subunit IV family protein [Deltaproteobacteria bacterium]|jgi:caa(3)-type oxidase subunit IV|nr:cytochrome C oxidase subunit IV family protein [Deltaproteobacteria bacterium]
MSEEHTHHPNYVKIWAILVVLLVISVTGPMIGIKWVTLFTAFGIAIVKAYMVVVNFMHIGATRRFVPYLVVTCLLFMFLFFAGVAPDVMKADGENWSKPSWLEAQAQAALEGDHPH